MTKNLGTLDRWVRGLVVAPALLILALAVGTATVLGAVALVLAAVMLGTAVVGFCPLYAPFHIDSHGHHGTR
jgi:hypothetical protein